MVAVLRGQRAGFDLEFLQRIGERQGKREVVVGIFMDGAVEQVHGGVAALSAGYGDHDGGVVTDVVDRAITGQTGHAGQQDQFERVAAVQRHFGDALVVDDLADAGRVGLDLDSVGFDGDLLVYRADFERNVEGRIGVDLEDDARLDGGAEAWFGCFDGPGADWEIGQYVCPVGARRDGTHAACGRVGRFDVSAGNGAAAGIPDGSVDLSRRLRQHNGAG